MKARSRRTHPAECGPGGSRRIRIPGDLLNPHKRAGAFCEILKHAGLNAAIRMLMEREPKILQTIASHKGSEQPGAFRLHPHDHVSARVPDGRVDRV